jgi:hypothetical protein
MTASPATATIARPSVAGRDIRCTRLRDASGFAQGGDHVAGEEERVEAGDEVEGVVVVRKRLHLSDAEIRTRQPLARELDERLGGVDPMWFAAALGDDAEEAPTPHPKSDALLRL